MQMYDIFNRKQIIIWFYSDSARKKHLL